LTSTRAAIRRGLEKITPGDTSAGGEQRAPTRGAPQEGKSNPEHVVPAELQAAMDALAGLRAPLDLVDQWITRLQADIDALQQQLPVPKDPARVDRRAARIGLGLTDLRHTMFMRGLLDEASAPSLPPPPEVVKASRSSAWRRLSPLLLAAEQSLEQMRAAAADVNKKLADLESEIRSLQRAIAEGTAGDSVDETIDALALRASALALGLREPMVTQLEAAQRIIAGCCEPFDDVGMMLGTLDDRIAELREAVDAAPREAQELRALRDAFGTVCADLEDASQCLELDAAGHPITLPENPFAGRRLQDRRVLTEMAVGVEVAEQAAAALHDVVIERRSRLDELNEQVAILQGKIADRLEAGEQVGGLRSRYAELTREVLALHDSAGGA
jgi:prefoldin subunit 5